MQNADDLATPHTQCLVYATCWFRPIVSELLAAGPGFSCLTAVYEAFGTSYRLSLVALGPGPVPGGVVASCVELIRKSARGICISVSSLVFWFWFLFVPVVCCWVLVFDHAVLVQHGCILFCCSFCILTLSFYFQYTGPNH